MSTRFATAPRSSRGAATGRSARLLSDALAFFSKGQTSAARALIHKILAREPQHRDARHLLAMVEFRDGDAENAAQRLQALIASFPDHAPLRNDLGIVLTYLERFADAEEMLVAALMLAPNVPGFHFNLARVYKELFLLADAEAHARAAIHHRNDYADAFRLLSEVLGLDGRTAEAVRMSEQALALAPNDVRNHIGLAEAYDANDRIADARMTLERALVEAPDSSALQDAYIQFLRERGFEVEATESIRRLLETKPDSPGLHSLLVQSSRFRERTADLAAAESLLGRLDKGHPGKSVLHFALAKAYEEIGDYPGAFAQALLGNTLERPLKRYSEAIARAEFDASRLAFTPDFLSTHGKAGFEDDTPIFVVGMPRSGTTLTEQILSRHRDVYGAGELRLLNSLVRDMRVRLEARDDVELCAKATDADWRALGETYITQLRRRAPDAKHVVDKMPDNFRFIGHIRTAMPRAKIVYCRRAAPDNCLSIFNINFASKGLAYGYDLAELGHYYRMHDGLMRHWLSVMPSFVLTNRYEEMVADQETQSRRLLAFCGLDWDEDVLNFHESTRRVRTASLAQVRKPIYQSSVGRYRRYGAAIAPLLEALGWDEEKGEVTL